MYINMGWLLKELAQFCTETMTSERLSTDVGETFRKHLFAFDLAFLMCFYFHVGSLECWALWLSIFHLSINLLLVSFHQKTMNIQLMSFSSVLFHEYSLLKCTVGAIICASYSKAFPEIGFFFFLNLF